MADLDVLGTPDGGHVSFIAGRRRLLAHDGLELTQVRHGSVLTERVTGASGPRATSPGKDPLSLPCGLGPPLDQKVQTIAYIYKLCKMLHKSPVEVLTPRALHAYLGMPGTGPVVQRAAIDEALDVGPSSVTRYLQELTDAGLVLRVGHGAYLVPRPPVRRLLLAEPSPYHREVLLLEDAYRDRPERAFACVPVRDAISMELPHAILVLPLDAQGPEEGPPQLARMRLEGPVGLCELPVPSDATPPASVAHIACTAPLDSLALLASTGDADLVMAAKAAAGRLRITADALAAAVRRLRAVPPGQPTGAAPHIVRHPAWLLDRVRAASVTALRHATREAVERGADP